MKTIIQERLQLQGDHRCSHKQHHYQQQEKWKQPKLFMQTLLKELHIHHAFQVKLKILAYASGNTTYIGPKN